MAFSLVLKGCIGALRFTSSSLTSTEPIKASFRGSCLLVEGKDSGCISFGGISVGGRCVTIGSSSMTFNGRRIQMGSSPDAPVMVDGVVYYPEGSSSSKESKTEEDDDHKKEWTFEELAIGSSFVLGSIEMKAVGELYVSGAHFSSSVNVGVQGAGRVIFDHHPLDNISASIAGSGDVCVIPATIPIKVATLSVAGSGDIDVGGALVGTLNVSVAGSGDVYGFHVTESGSCNVAGSGDIHGTKAAGVCVSESVMGSGYIRIQEVK